MSKAYRSRTAAVSALNTRTGATTLGSESAPGQLTVPASAKKLLGVIVAVACDLATAADGGHIVRLEGSGLPKGPEVVVAGASGVQVATGGSYANPALFIPLEAAVTPGNEILLAAENTGEDSGTTEIGITLVFEV